MKPTPYSVLPVHEQRGQFKYLWDFIHDFMKFTLGYPPDMKVEICGIDLVDIIVRVDKRRHYFEVFHLDMPKINECKMAGLVAYWIVKFRPIMITDPRFKNLREGYNTDVNEKFAIHFLLCTLASVGKLKFWDGKEGLQDLDFNNWYIKELVYSFRFRNFTIDSMLVLADSITTETFYPVPKSRKTAAAGPSA